MTGALGEVGSGLITQLAGIPGASIIATDRREPTGQLPACVTFSVGDICDPDFVLSLGAGVQFDAIIHLAAILSSSAEQDPFRAHDVNVRGSINAFALAEEQFKRYSTACKFMFASSCAVYGIRPPVDKFEIGAVSETAALDPTTMYGITKLYIERLGRFFNQRGIIDFRCLRFPGLLSPDTLPSGGTSDYGPEMLHAAARGEPYQCFVDGKTTLPFMAMSDAVAAMTTFLGAERSKLNRAVYNVTSFSVSAEEIEQLVRNAFPDAEITYQPEDWRIRLVRSWPAAMDDTAARNDWGWQPQLNKQATFRDYLVPGVQKTLRIKIYIIEWRVRSALLLDKKPMRSPFADWNERH